MKPGDFYIGMSEFFSVLLPGFIVAATAADHFEQITLKTLVANEWAMLLIIAYITGHILFALGSYWDDLYEKLKPIGNEPLLDEIAQIRAANQERDCAAINEYQWCRSLLSFIHPEGFNEVLRKEADSKLFRSLILPFLIAPLLLLQEQSQCWAWGLLVLALVAFWRYRGQRFKACKIAYTHVIVLHQLGKFETQNEH